MRKFYLLLGMFGAAALFACAHSDHNAQAQSQTTTGAQMNPTNEPSAPQQKDPSGEMPNTGTDMSPGSSTWGTSGTSGTPGTYRAMDAGMVHAGATDAGMVHGGAMDAGMVTMDAGVAPMPQAPMSLEDGGSIR